jgi:uncharacterized membrane protein
MSLPPIPDWDALHPLIVHFPIALLLVAPLFVVAGLLVRRSAVTLSAVALALMVLGTAGTWVAVATGEASAELADRSPVINAAIEQHEELAETTRAVFTGLTVVFAVLLAARVLVPHRIPAAINLGAQVVFLGGFLAGTVLLANTAHHGGVLVHEHGVHVLLPLDASTAAPQASVVGAGGLVSDDD